jgi:3-hydroxyacyl-[acyl-carrier-protein] dehydratase
VEDSTLRSSTDPIDLGLPHKPPFLFVQAIVTCDPGVSAECETTFERDDPMFAGHFPDNPLVPGVILTEALAQTAGIAAAGAYAEKSPPRFLLSGIRQMKFFHAVRPGQRIVLRAETLAQVDDLLQFRVEALVDGKQVAAGQLVLNTIPESSRLK